MKISSSGPLHDQNPLKKTDESQGVEKNQDPKRSPRPPAAQGSDRIQISERAREAARVSEIVQATPDIRVQKVEELKRAVDAGTYDVPGHEVAAKMLEQIQEGWMGLF